MLENSIGTGIRVLTDAVVPKTKAAVPNVHMNDKPMDLVRKKFLHHAFRIRDSLSHQPLPDTL